VWHMYVWFWRCFDIQSVGSETGDGQMDICSSVFTESNIPHTALIRCVQVIE